MTFVSLSAPGGGNTSQMDYDLSAGHYAAHRQIHPGVFRELCDPLALARASGPAFVLEVGCGTGNYISSLAAKLDIVAFGTDPSAGMLSYARAHPGQVGWQMGRAESLPFAHSSFDLIFSVDVIHHVVDKPAFLCEAARTLKPGGQICTITDSADIIRRREILSGYFPETVEHELLRYPPLALLERWMAEAGFVETRATTVAAPYSVTDAGPFRAKAYSALHGISDRAWRAGLARLERELSKGPVQATARYACIWGTRAG